MFSLRLFGYDRMEVEQKLSDLDAKIQELTTAHQQAQTTISQLQAQIEDYEIRLAAARRDRVQALAKTGAPQPNAVVILGPVDTFAVVASLAEAIEKREDLSVQFQIYRDGLYRLDIWVEGVNALADWIRSQPGVREVSLDGNTIHVTLRES